MAIKKTVEINIDTKDAVKSMTDLGATFEDVNGEIQPMSGRMGDLEDRLYELANAGDTSSKEFKDLTGEIGRMKKVIIDTDMVVDGMSQTMAQNVGGALGGLTSGFELGAGAMGAFGAESEQVEEALLKVQSAMAIAQGVQGIRESIPHFKKMRTAIMGNVVVQKLLNFVMSINPIGLIIAAVVALGAALYALATPIRKLTDWFYGVEDATLSVEEANEKLNKSYEKTTNLIDKIGEAAKKRLGHELNMLSLTGASEEDLHKKRLQIIKAEELIRNASRSAESDAIKKKQQLYRNALANDNAKLATSIKDEIKQHREKFADLKSQDKDYDRAKQELEQEEANRIADKRKTDYDNYKTHLEKKLALERMMQDESQKLNRDDAAYIKILRERELKDIKASTELNEEQKRIRTAQINQQYNEQELADATIFFETRKVQAVEAKETEEREIQTVQVTKAEETGWKLKDIDLEVMNARLDMASNMFGALGELATAFAGDSEAQQKRAFNINKVVGISQAVISTAQGIMAQLAVPQDALTGANFIKAGIVAATGAAQIATIAKTKFQGGGSAPSAPSSSTGGGESRPASFNVVGNDSNNQLAESLGGQVTKAYVVSGDVTTAQSLERNKIQTATL